jgi:hypothetical protein
MTPRKVWLALKTPVTMLVLLVFVLIAGAWAYTQTLTPVPPRPPDPCVVTSVGPKFTAANAWIRIYNGTTTSNLAKNTKLIFGNAGFHVIKIATADTPAAKTFIVGVGPNSPEVVLVRSYFPAATPFTADPQKLDHTVDITLGKDFKPATLSSKPLASVALKDGKACIPVFKDVSATS